MKYLFAIFMIFITLNFSNAQKPCIKPAPFFHGGGIGNTDKGNQVVSDQSNNIYIVAYTKDTCLFNGDTIPFISGSTSSYLAKIDSSGKMVWSSYLEKLSTPKSDLIRTVTVDEIGNVYIAGYFKTDTLLVGVDTVVLQSENSILIKYDHNGNVIWHKDYQSMFSNTIIKIVYHNQHIYTVGYFTDQLSFDTFNLTGTSNDVWVSKVDLMGNIIWAKSFGGPGYDRGYGIGVDGNENVYVIGQFMDKLVIEQDTFISLDSYDAFMTKININGDFLWTKTFNGPGTYQNLNNIHFDNDNNIYAVGSYRDTMNFDTDTIIISDVSDDIMIFKLDSNGLLKWINSYNYGTADNGYDLVINDDSTLYLLAQKGSYSSYEGKMLLKKIHHDGTDKSEWMFGGKSGGGGAVLEVADLAKSADGKIFFCGTYSTQDVVFNGDTINNQFGEGIPQMIIGYFDDFSIDAPIIVGDSQLCIGDSLLLSTIDTNNIFWSDGLGDSNFVVISPLADSSMYHLTTSSYKGCEASDSIMIIFYKQDTPEILLNIDTLTSSFIGNNYQWMYNGAYITGATNNFYLPTQSGSYKLVLIDSNYCSNTSPSFDYIATQVDNINPVNGLLYPNPTTGELTLELGDVYETITLNVRTVIGQLVSTHVHESKNKLTFELKDLPGIYIIEVLNEKGNSAKFRVVKQ